MLIETGAGVPGPMGSREKYYSNDIYTLRG
jgi:hypothetical protein